MGLMAIELHTPSPRSRSHSFSLFWSSLIFYGQNFENRWPYLCHRHFMLFNASVNANGDDTHFCGGLWRRFRPLGRTVVPIRTVTRPPHNPQTSRASCIWNINYCNIHLKLISDTHTHTHTHTHRGTVLIDMFCLLRDNQNYSYLIKDNLPDLLFPLFVKMWIEVITLYFFIIYFENSLIF